MAEKNLIDLRTIPEARLGKIVTFEFSGNSGSIIFNRNLLTKIRATITAFTNTAGVGHMTVDDYTKFPLGSVVYIPNFDEDLLAEWGDFLYYTTDAPTNGILGINKDTSGFTSRSGLTVKGYMCDSSKIKIIGMSTAVVPPDSDSTHKLCFVSWHALGLVEQANGKLFTRFSFSVIDPATALPVLISNSGGAASVGIRSMVTFLIEGD